MVTDLSTQGSTVIAAFYFQICCYYVDMLDGFWRIIGRNSYVLDVSINFNPYHASLTFP